MTNESETIKKHPDFSEWLKSADGLSSNDISTLTEQKYLTNRLFWAFDAGRNCVWDQYLEQKKALRELSDFVDRLNISPVAGKPIRDNAKKLLKV